MMNRVANTAKLSLVVTIVLLAAVGIMHVIDVWEAEEAQALAVKVMWFMGIFAVASCAIVAVAGSGAKSATDRENA